MGERGSFRSPEAGEPATEFTAEFTPREPTAMDHFLAMRLLLLAMEDPKILPQGSKVREEAEIALSVNAMDILRAPAHQVVPVDQALGALKKSSNPGDRALGAAFDPQFLKAAGLIMKENVKAAERSLRRGRQNSLNGVIN